MHSSCFSGQKGPWLYLCVGIRKWWAESRPLFMWRLHQQHLHHLSKQHHSERQKAVVPGGVLLYSGHNLQQWRQSQLRRCESLSVYLFDSLSEIVVFFLTGSIHSYVFRWQQIWGSVALMSTLALQHQPPWLQESSPSHWRQSKQLWFICALSVKCGHLSVRSGKLSGQITSGDLSSLLMGSKFHIQVLLSQLHCRIKYLLSSLLSMWWIN